MKAGENGIGEELCSRVRRYRSVDSHWKKIEAMKRQNSLEMSSCVVVSSPSAHYVESLETEKVPRQMMSL